MKCEIHFLLFVCLFVSSPHNLLDNQHKICSEREVLRLNPAATAFQGALQYEKQIYQTRGGRK